VKKAADEFLSKDWPLHCLLLNAGLYEPLNDVSADGYGYVMAVNHLAHYYLNKLLLDRLERTAKQLSPDDLFGGWSLRICNIFDNSQCVVRVVYVSSEAHRMVGFPSTLTADQLTESVLFDKRPRGVVG